MSKKYLEAEIRMMKRLRKEKLSYGEIAMHLNHNFDRNRTAHAVRIKLNRHRVKTRKYNKFSMSETKDIIDLSTAGATQKQIAEIVNEKYQNDRSQSAIAQKIYSQPPETEIKESSRLPWTREESNFMVLNANRLRITKPFRHHKDTLWVLTKLVNEEFNTGRSYNAIHSRLSAIQTKPKSRGRSWLYRRRVKKIMKLQNKIDKLRGKLK